MVKVVPPKGWKPNKGHSK